MEKELLPHACPLLVWMPYSTPIVALPPPPLTGHGELTLSFVRDRDERWWMTFEEESVITPPSHFLQTVMAWVQASHFIMTIGVIFDKEPTHQVW